MELKVWPGEHNIPSIDFESLQIWTLAKLSGVPVKVQVSGHSLWRPLPVLKHEKKYYSSFAAVSKLFTSLKVNPDHHLTDKMKSDITAYTAMLKEKLRPAIQYTWWLDQKNFETVTRPTFAKASSWPLNFYYPGYFQRQAIELLEAFYMSIEDLDYIASEVFGNAQVCLNTLSAILGDKKYFFGDTLSSFDATLYAYLCPTLKKNFPNKKLESHIKGCSNLVQYVDRITKELFPEAYKEGVSPSQENVSELSRSTRALSKRDHMILSAIIAVTSLSSFAYFSGVVDFGKKAVEDDERTTKNERYSGVGSFYENLYA